MKSMFAVLLIFTACGVAQNSDTPSPTREAHVAAAVKGILIIKARAGFKDPQSLHVDNAFFTTNKKGHDFTCYETRAKNGFGGYTNGIAAYDVTEDKWGDERFFWDRGGCFDKRQSKEDVTAEVKAALKAAREKDDTD
jgi:hypothetical protein